MTENELASGSSKYSQSACTRLDDAISALALIFFGYACFWSFFLDQFFVDFFIYRENFTKKSNQKFRENPRKCPKTVKRVQF